jgi:hypothetical protein
MLTPVLVAALAATQPAPQPQVVERSLPKPETSGSDSCLRLELARIIPVIPVTIEGRELKVGFDTGAPGGPHLPLALLRELGAEQVGEAMMSDPSLRNPIPVGLYRIDGLRIGNVEIDNWIATARDDPRPSALGIDGIVGLDAFDGFVVTIDYPSGRLVLTRGRLPEPDGETSFRYEGPIPSVPLTLDGQTIAAHIDTGNARYALIAPTAAADALPGRSDAFPVGLARTINNTFTLMAVPVDEARVGALDLHAGTVAFPSPGPNGNLGSLLLRDMVVKIDPANRIVALERSAGAEDGCLA